MQILSDKRFYLQLLRHAALLMLLVPVYSYLTDILSPLFIIVVFVAAAVSGLLLERSRFRFIPAFLVSAAGAFVVRFFVFAVSGVLSASMDNAVVDFTFFRFDSGFFPLFPAVLYISAVSFLSRRKPGFVPVEVVLNAVILVLLLWKQGGYNISVFPHPGILAVFCIVFILIEISVLLLSVSASSGGRILSFLAVAVPILLVVLFLLFGRYSEGASQGGGGLMQPTLFRFDFSDYVKLETEITMDNDLVLLFRNYGYLNSVYLRRFYLSGYKPDRGFYLQEGPGEAGQQLNLPDRPVKLDVPRFPQRIESQQEYFIVNIDPSSLIAMNYPIEISPLTNWQGSSFLQNYSVVSESVELPSWELADSPILEIDSGLFDFYTEYGDDPQIKQLAEEITEGLENPYDRVIAIMFYLHDTYYYSLKPGVAADGNQLHHFLFESRKGYCSYFAFSMTLMCRSLGIPARVAAGFFIDPQSGILNVYPVREDMAHAWVEVPFEDFGWVEFDPTTDRLAPGEELEFSALDSSEYSDLIEEIFANDYKIEIDAQPETEISNSDSFFSAVKKLGRLLRLNPGRFLLFLYIVGLSVFHLREAAAVRSANTVRRIRASYRRARRLSSAFGLRRTKSESVLEHARVVEKSLFGGFLPIAELYLESVFSAGMSPDVKARLSSAYRLFRRSYRQRRLIKRLIIFLFPFVRMRRIRAVKSTKASFFLPLILMILMSFLPFPASAQDVGPGFYLEAAGREQDSENYEAGLKLLNEGISLYPENWELKKAAGDLYADRELFHLALEQYNLALEISIDNTEIIYQRSVVEGLLNMDVQSILSLEKLLSIIPDHYDALADLGWMYFKTYRLAEAESLLLEAVKLYEDSPILYMTLGTVYSGMYDYENAEHYYLESIEMALVLGWDYFASVSYYNLSLLEHGFYRYEKSLEYTNKSIETGERAPGYIAKAEIYLGRLDFETSFSNYQQAYIIDSTPLALMGLADLYSTYGMLDEALAHMEEVLKHDDDSWMYYFGVDPDRHRMETDRILMEIYYGLSKRERFSPSSGFKRARAAFDSIRYYAYGWYHERRYRSASFDVGASNESQGNNLDAAWAYFISNEDYGRSALRYLQRAELIETRAAPGAEGSYLLERGRLNQDAVLLSQAVSALDQEWERLQITEALTELVKLNKKQGNTDTARRQSEELYKLNPGVFITNGVAFPLALEFSPGFLLRHSLKSSGFDILLNYPDNSYRYRLTVADSKEVGVLYSVIDNEKEEILFQIPVRNKLNTPHKVSVFTAELKKRLFSITDGKDDSF